MRETAEETIAEKISKKSSSSFSMESESSYESDDKAQITDVYKLLDDGGDDEAVSVSSKKAR